MKVLALVVLIIIIVVILSLQQTDGFQMGPTGAFNIVKGTRITKPHAVHSRVPNSS